VEREVRWLSLRKKQVVLVQGVESEYVLLILDPRLRIYHLTPVLLIFREAKTNGGHGQMRRLVAVGWVGLREVTWQLCVRCRAAAVVAEVSISS
jgi:hypothetical protein